LVAHFRGGKRCEGLSFPALLFGLRKRPTLDAMLEEQLVSQIRKMPLAQRLELSTHGLSKRHLDTGAPAHFALLEYMRSGVTLQRDTVRSIHDASRHIDERRF
jgi:hypothetical protein